MAPVNRSPATQEHSAPSPHSEADREIRFGLVLYGGVSLAVYIYGVVLEFERLIRASCGVEENAWTQVLREARVTATVDIVSGASAGGINGVLLGKALATGAKLSSVRSIWTSDADIGSLLRNPGEKEPASLLRTDRFQELLEDGLARMDETASGEPLVSAFDLFIASTRLQPWKRIFSTDLSGTISTRDYRKSFELKLRSSGYNRERRKAGYDRNDFAASENPILAQVARATSAFPVAFEPQLIERNTENERFFDPDEPPASYFSDGGILHNKPFTETISTIFSRAASRPVSRWLVSVEPDPERIRTQAEAVEPNVAEVASKAAMEIPRYQSIAADLERLKEHRRRARTARTKLAGIDGVLLERIDELQREAGGSDELLRPWRDEVLAASDYQAERRRRYPAVLANRLASVDDGAPGWDGAAVLELAAGYGLEELPDPDFEQRRIYRLLEMTRELQSLEEFPLDTWSDLEQARLRLWAQFDRIDELVWELFGPRGGPLDPGAALEALALGLNGVGQELAEVCGSLDRIAWVAKGDDSRRFSKVFRWFELWDAQLLTIAEVSGIDARDEIRLGRISPTDAKYIEKPASKKLAGDSLGHFGGFLKESWRCNDLLWGRLDAAEMICRMIFRGEGEAPAEPPEDQLRTVQEQIARAEIPDITGDYRYYMENKHRVGEEKLKDVPMEDRAELALQAGDVIRNMFRGLGNAERLPGPLQWLASRVGRVLGFVLAVFRWPIRAGFGRDPAVRRAIDLAVFFVGLWSVVSVLLVFLGVIGDTNTLWGLIGLGLLVFSIWCGVHAYKRAKKL